MVWLILQEPIRNSLHKLHVYMSHDVTYTQCDRTLVTDVYEYSHVVKWTQKSVFA
jgi:hypothetical protein